MDAGLSGKIFEENGDFAERARQAVPCRKLVTVAEVARAQGALPSYPNFNAWLDRIHARPAWKRALAKGGEYALGR